MARLICGLKNAPKFYPTLAQGVCQEVREREVLFGYAGVKVEAVGREVGIGIGIQERVLIGLSNNNLYINGYDRAGDQSIKKFSADFKFGVVGAGLAVEEKIPRGSSYGSKSVTANVLVGLGTLNGIYKDDYEFKRNHNTTPVKVALIGGKIGIGIIGAEGGIDLNLGIHLNPALPAPSTGYPVSESTAIPKIIIK